MGGDRLIVPRADGGVLAVPEVNCWAELVSKNRAALATAIATIGGCPLSNFRTLARQELLECCIRHHAALDQPVGHVDPEAPLIVTGHQPELFHPGVWVKNFAIAALARRLGGWSVNVLIDNDVMKQSAIRVPAGRADAPIVAFVPFDRWEAEVPFEERTVVDERVFNRFADVVAERMSLYAFRPQVREFWGHACKAARHTRNLGERLAAARQAIERSAGCCNYETPLHRLCCGRAFGLLVGELLSRVEDFAGQHNRALADFRRANRIKNRTHPVPELQRSLERVEVPLWAWRAEQPTRRRVFAGLSNGDVTLLAGDEIIGRIQGVGSSAEAIAEALARALGPWKLRPRALLTTMFLRLGFSDLFVHGVGGGKYDAVTDDIIQRFFGIAPPAFAILSATLLLPIAGKAVDDRAFSSLTRQRRDLVWNPDRYLDAVLRDQEPIANWVERKFDLMEEPEGSRAERTARFREFRRLNEHLREYLGTKPQELERQWSKHAADLAAARLLANREFAFCLHPQDALTVRLTKIADGEVPTR
jgi:hypothetical protein